MSDKTNDVILILNDLIDVVEEMSSILEELNPGANWQMIKFMTNRTSRLMNELLESIERERA